MHVRIIEESVYLDVVYGKPPVPNSSGTASL